MYALLYKKKHFQTFDNNAKQLLFIFKAHN